MIRIAARLDRALKAAGVPIVGVSIPDAANRASWLVHPRELQEMAQPVIDTFNPDDPAYAAAELRAASLGASRHKDVLTTCALIVRGRGIGAWNAMSAQQKTEAVLAEADAWRSMREFLDDKV